MKTKRLTPRNLAPVQRDNTATISRRDGNALVAPQFSPEEAWLSLDPFAGDDAQ